MRVTDWTREVLEYRREEKRMTAAGFEKLGEGGGRLWEIYRGGRHGQRILEAHIACDGMSVWIKIGKVA